MCKYQELKLIVVNNFKSTINPVEINKGPIQTLLFYTSKHGLQLVKEDILFYGLSAQLSGIVAGTTARIGGSNP